MEEMRAAPGRRFCEPLEIEERPVPEPIETALQAVNGALGRWAAGPVEDRTVLTL